MEDISGDTEVYPENKVKNGVVCNMPTSVNTVGNVTSGLKWTEGKLGVVILIRDELIVFVWNWKSVDGILRVVEIKSIIVCCSVIVNWSGIEVVSAAEIYIGKVSVVIFVGDFVDILTEVDDEIEELLETFDTVDEVFDSFDSSPETEVVVDVINDPVEVISVLETASIVGVTPGDEVPEEELVELDSEYCDEILVFGILDCVVDLLEATEVTVVFTKLGKSCEQFPFESILKSIKGMVEQNSL